MIDPIKEAITNYKLTLDVSNSLPTRSEILDNIDQKKQKISNAKKKLPTVKNKNLKKNQLKAKAQKDLADKKQQAIEAKELAFKNAKNSAKNSASTAISAVESSIPKPPINSQKVKSSLLLAKQAKETIKERKASSVATLTQNKNLFKFPMNPSIAMGIIPSALSNITPFKKISISELLKPELISPLETVDTGTCYKLSNNVSRALCQKAYAEGITDKVELAQFLAQAEIESDTFRKLQESLFYTSASRLLDVFNKIFKSEREAAPFLRRPIQLANKVYARKNGNILPGDGYKFRGRGFLQITGRYNYDQFKKFSGKNVIDNPDYLSTFRGAIESSLWYWKNQVRPRLSKVNGNYSNTSQVTFTINTKLEKLKEREVAFNRIYSLFLQK